MKTRFELYRESIERLQKIEKGMPVTNVCAGESNPIRLCYFVRLVEKSRKNKFGIVHVERLAKVKDKRGHIHNIGIEVIYPGHIDCAECEKIFSPIHAALFS